MTNVRVLPHTFAYFPDLCYRDFRIQRPDERNSLAAPLPDIRPDSSEGLTGSYHYPAALF